MTYVEGQQIDEKTLNPTLPSVGGFIDQSTHEKEVKFRGEGKVRLRQKGIHAFMRAYERKKSKQAINEHKDMRYCSSSKMPLYKQYTNASETEL